MLRQLRADLGGGSLRGEGAWTGADRWRAQVDIAGVDPAALHGALASQPVSGRLQAQGAARAIDFDADNPGRWMFHCHNAYHFEAGMTADLHYVR